MKITVFCIISLAFITLVTAGYGHSSTTTCSQCPVNECGFLPQEFAYSCPNGNILNSCGCVESCQCAGCPEFNISLPCPNGKRTDANGCPLSECNPVCEFSSDCAAVTCGVGGIAADENGCPLRDCPCQSPNCPPVVGCNIDCSTNGGYRRVNGCVTCQCNGCEFAGDCAAVTCPAEFGVAIGEDSCPLRGCPCQGAANCPTVLFCDIDCSNRGGYKLVNGCVVCQCNRDAVCEFAGDCAAVSCLADYGNAADKNGCPLRGCPCQGAANCPPVQNCNLDCSRLGGYRTVSGCVTCQCAQKPGLCPKTFALGTACHTDYDCPGSEKCCSVGRYYRVMRCRRPYLRYY